eukprot:gb/GECG01010077.1/.p1 GENE.gb/GECG01010077.1/~~gb/GECG01010077.1/.p1  ORF type:complete len:132 (+),score=20.06 gb/GECG01010077.1/:1-396(+)
MENNTEGGEFQEDESFNVDTNLDPGAVGSFHSGTSQQTRRLDNPSVPERQYLPPFAHPDHSTGNARNSERYGSSLGHVPVGYEEGGEAEDPSQLLYFRTDIFKSSLPDSSRYPVQYQYTVTGKTRKKQYSR